MTRHYPGVGSAPDWLKQISLSARPTRNITQIWVVIRHHRSSAFVPQTLFRKASGGVAKYWLFFQVKLSFHIVFFRFKRVFGRVNNLSVEKGKSALAEKRSHGSKTPVAAARGPTTQRGPFRRPVIIREGFAEIIFCIRFPMCGM